MPDVRRLDSVEELLTASGHHPVVELDIGAGMEPPAWAVTTAAGTAVAFARHSDSGVLGVSVLGPVDGIGTLVADPRVRAWFTAGPFHHLSRPREAHDVVERHLPVGPDGGDWDWMYTRAAPEPPLPGEDRVVTLTPAARADVVDLLTRESPRTHGRPFAADDQRWMGVWDGDRLVASGCSAPSTAGVPVLSGIAVDSAHRRRGLGSAVTSALARDAVARTGACVLGVFSDNDAGRALYERLGFVVAVRWRSRWRSAARAEDAVS
ncbi:GNAT family N-acetyltransferase [Phycicoccus flavus]|uniref:GNAT family N-acetyltransferase n=1 Tax=Phycicoccus flavus TaxID=2502783 RepID=UPI000FEB87DF|nr:GNAT family N-acetyltransferase [Phycicoccus flavus]NHA69188.1 GNAT family N-acetyltransferase [Phycicoccus flavus]